MSTPDAMATVTATLQHLLTGIAPGASVTTQPPSTARSSGSGEQLNIFLYSAHHNTAFSNAPMPGETRPGELAYPPLPLVLKYLITAYGQNDDDISGQQLMGAAMSLLHDHPLLGPSDISGISPDSGLHEQIERIRITPDSLSLDDMSKLWTSFQSAEYRLSAGYQVSVVLIESDRSGRAPLPVLKRGDQDRGAQVLASPPATLTGVRFEHQKPAAELGDVVTLLGDQFSADNTVVRFTHPQLNAPIDVPMPPSVTDTEIMLPLPTITDDAQLGFHWPAGFYSVSLRVTRPDTPAMQSNAVTMPLAPSVMSLSPLTAPAGNLVLTLECLPQIKPDQRVRLLFGERMFTPASLTTPADPAARTTLTFDIDSAQTSVTPYVVRLRVDGADSIPVDFSGVTPLFAADQQVTIS